MFCLKRYRHRLKRVKKGSLSLKKPLSEIVRKNLNALHKGDGWKGGMKGWTGIPIDTNMVLRGGGEHSISRARSPHLERDIMVARGNEKVLKARGPHDNVLLNIKKGLGFWDLL